MAEYKGKLFSKSVKLMGNNFVISAVHDDEKYAYSSIDAAINEIQRIESKFTTFSDTSETFRVNENAGIQPVTVSEEFYGLVERAQKISQITQGAFDLSYGGLDKSLWNFDTKMKSLPSSELARKSVSKIDFNKIILNRETKTIFLKENGMRIGFGGIGKGYAADRAAKVIKEKGINSGVINASGDIVTWGTHPSGEDWNIGVLNPNLNNHISPKITARDIAVATSGNYEKYIEIDGVRYSHTINPNTGLPIRGVKSVTTICQSGEFADAITTPIMVMGIESGLYMVNQIKGLETIIIDDNDNVYLSEGLKSFL